MSFDIETRRLSTDMPGGWRDVLDGKAGCSAFVCYPSEPGRPFLFDENTLSEGVSCLEDADVVLSYAGSQFDIPVLEAMMGRNLNLRQHLDLFSFIKDALYRRQMPLRGYKLGEVSERTLGIPKDGCSVDAPTLADRGLWASLFQYCLTDAWLTLELFRFAHKKGGIIDLDGELLPLQLPEWFLGSDI